MKQLITIKINQTKLTGEVDTGCPVILIGAQHYRQHFSTIHTHSPICSLFDASGNQLNILGSFRANISANNRSGVADILIQHTQRQFPLIGTEGLNILFSGWQQTFTVNHVSLETKILNLIKSNYKNLIDSNDFIRGFEIDLPLKDGAIQVFAGSRPIPYALMP